MTSAVGGGGGSQKNRQKEQNQLFCDSDRGGKKIREFFGRHIWKLPIRLSLRMRSPGPKQPSFSSPSLLSSSGRLGPMGAPQLSRKSTPIMNGHVGEGVIYDAN